MRVAYVSSSSDVMALARRRMGCLRTAAKDQVWAGERSGQR